MVAAIIISVLLLAAQLGYNAWRAVKKDKEAAARHRELVEALRVRPPASATPQAPVQQTPPAAHVGGKAG